MEHKNLRESVYADIKACILSCQYAPGSFLNETDISRKLGVSRTPIREAFSRLEKETFITVYPKRGVQVTNVTISDVNEIFQARKLIETHNIATYGHAIPLETLLEMKDKMIQQENDGLDFQLDMQLHQLVINIGRNRYLTDLCNNVCDLGQRVRAWVHKDNYDSTETLVEHFAIVDALIASDYPLAAKAMSIHLSNSSIRAIEGLMKTSP